MGNTWFKWLSKWNMKLQKYMRGRYGVFDSLSRSLLVVSLALILINLFFGTNILRWAAFIILALVYYRFFSKKIYRRSNENQKYIVWMNKEKKKFGYLKERIQNRKTYTYFSCPECHQHLRAPKNKGTIKVTCSSCKTQFNKKV
ncbi:hypothetical protein IW492_07415 [Enterococcus sp. BWB1-3]|uniref:hypothetical protein n=1 Tax=unclassified Enterococcus TaxID=2608891 RepID=UPI0019207DDA|nr:MULTISPECIES: hypothetical protein [unclassified Enterococcus]MBL1229061.1 hypothetical protein [Enterococcus sp. BWB1-3]MCB5955444.1 hypothetical protein [Enterococcus sp. CWB-B31]